MLAISRNIIILVSAGLILLLVGCGVSTEDVVATDEVSPVKEEAEIVNTATPLPPTATPVPPTSTPIHKPTPTQLPAQTPTVMPTFTPVSPTATPKPPTVTPTPVPTATGTLHPDDLQIFVKWSNWETGEWSPSSTPPKCGPLEDMFNVFPLDIAVVDVFTPPGRPGGNGSYYISHGHLRSQNTPHNQIDVKFPAEGFSLYAVNRRLEDYYIEEKETDTIKHIADDEEQVKLEFHHPCGIKIMIDHIAQINDRWSEIIKNVPVLLNDSGVTFMPDGQYFVESGEVLGYAIGHSTNTNLDFGVYDLRNKNDLAEMMARDWPQYAITASHAICWTDLFGAETQKLLEGKAVSSSDFCKIPTSTIEN